MKILYFIFIFGFLLSENTFATQHQNDVAKDSTSYSTEIEIFKNRYNNYLRILSSSNVPTISTYRRYYIERIYNQKGDENLLYPANDIIQFKAPVKLTMSYFVHFENYQINDVDIISITIYDSGYSIIYHEYIQDVIIDYYNLNINTTNLENSIMEQLIKRNIKIEHTNNRRYDEMKIQLFYHRQYEAK